MVKTALLSCFALSLFPCFALPAGAAQTPSILFSTYHGGSSADEGNKVAVGADGSLWVAGTTGSPDLPAATNAPDDPDLESAFVSRWSPDGRLLFSTYFGIAFPEQACGLAVQADGTSFAAALATDPASGETLIAIARIAPDGTLERTVFTSPPREPSCAGLALAPDGRLWLAGSNTNDLGLRQGFLESYDAQLNSGGDTYFRLDLYIDTEVRTLAVGLAGDLWLAGSESASPYGFNVDAFVARLSPDGQQTRWTAYAGGSREDEAWAIAVDPAGNSWITGLTTSTDLPLLRPVQSQPGGGGQDAFVAAFGPGGAPLSMSYLGGPGRDLGTGIAASSSGAVVTGFMGDQAFVTWLTLGGTSAGPTLLLPRSLANDVSLDTQGIATVTGWTSNPDFPTVHPSQPSLNGPRDAFLMRLAPNLPPDCSAAAATPATVWPPNGRLVPVAIAGVTNPDGDPVALTVTAIRQDEPLTGNGPDAAGFGTGQASVRADRAGSGDGRVYHVRFTAADPQGAICTGEVTVCVPHDRRPGGACGDGGPRFDSTGLR